MQRNSTAFASTKSVMTASQINRYAQALDYAEITEALSRDHCEADPACALERLILSPLRGFAAPEEGVRYILIGALDNTRTSYGVRSRSIVDILTSRLDRLPSWMRIVATTRYEKHILDRLRDLRAEKIDTRFPSDRRIQRSSQGSPFIDIKGVTAEDKPRHTFFIFFTGDFSSEDVETWQDLWRPRRYGGQWTL